VETIGIGAETIGIGAGTIGIGAETTNSSSRNVFIAVLRLYGHDGYPQNLSERTYPPCPRLF
jgi:hypothetical protein